MKYKTTNSEYKQEAENNNALAAKQKEDLSPLIQALFPEFFQLNDLLKTLGLSLEDVVDYVYNLSVVKGHGYGTVEVVITDGKINRIEAMIRTVKNSETMHHLNVTKPGSLPGNNK